VALALLGVLAAYAPRGAAGAGETGPQDKQEQRLLAILKSDAPLFDRARACQQLAVVGGRKAVPALAALLGDERLGDYARFALEPIDDPSVDEALRNALGRLEGRLLAGVVTSIGVRRDTKAVGALAKLARGGEKAAASAALAALGRIATNEAIEALRQGLAKGPAPHRTAAADACLAAAERLRAAGEQEAAASLYDAVRRADVPPHVLASAVQGAILARGQGGLGLLVEALRAQDREVVRAAMGAARELPGRAVSEKLAAELGRARPAVQVLLIDVLADRGDPGARKAIGALAAGDAPAVRLAAVEALGRIGDAAAVGILVKAIGAGGQEAAAASRSLRMLQAPIVDEAILISMKDAKAEVCAELIDVLVARRCTAAAGALLPYAAGPEENTARAALKALGALAEPEHLPNLLRLLVEAKGDRLRSEAENAVVQVAGRVPDAAKRADAVLAALSSAARPAARCGLIRALGRIGGAKAYKAVAAAADDDDETIRDAGVRALAAWDDGRAKADLLKIVRTTRNETRRVLALRGYVRLLGLDAARGEAPTVRKYAEVLAITRRNDSKKLILGGLAGVGHVDALKLAIEHLDDPAVAAEAASAAVTIARAVMGADRDAARAAMEKLLAVSKDKRIAAEARQVIAQIDRFADSLTAWRVAGPYARKGVKYDRLFDVGFEPEKPGAKGVAWRKLPAGTDPKRPLILDLLKAIGGEQRVAYALTWIHSQTAQPARLELGSDDGVKAWLNGRLVHANNVARAAVAYTDRADVTLQAGWNPLLLKITQNDSAWEFCARVCRRDGRRLDGIRVDAAHEGDWMPAAKRDRTAP